ARSGPALPTLPRRDLSRARPHPDGRRRRYGVLYPGSQIVFDENQCRKDRPRRDRKSRRATGRAARAPDARHSIAQATELGTVYTPDEVEAIGAFARAHRMLLHMDGARFANAVASLGCSPKTTTWKAGVDVLSFGGTKNGVAAGELVIFFDKKSSRDFQYRVKQAGHLGSKTRFLAAPWLGVVNGDVWLRNARHANEAARK